ncbi:MAG: GMC oxidoreductase [Propylenella sp.]
MLIGVADVGRVASLDCCIIGTGPAGITCALTLAAAGLRVLLLEGGDFDWNDESQELYKGKVVGDPYHQLEAVRLRYFGGTSGHWSGWCRPLDDIDFRNKGSFGNTAWPIGKADLDPFLADASAMLELTPLTPDEGLLESSLKRIHFAYSPPVRFGEKYREAILSSSTIHLALGANVTSINSSGGTVGDVTVETFDGQKVKVIARRYVLATGGIENSRILLWSNVANGGQVVSNTSALGRFWMEHPHFTLGDAIVKRELAAVDPGSESTDFFSLVPEKQEGLDVLNCGLRLKYRDHAGTAGVIEDIACVAPRFGKWALEQLGKGLVCGPQLRAAWEQEPRAENEVTLSATERDRFGVPLTELHWRKSKNDLRTVRVTALEFGNFLVKSDLGRLKIHDWVLGRGDYPMNDELAGAHHMGGTRMSDDPSRGVVDSNCRVHGQDNLYVAGSSVFPSTGHANPTLTIVQLSLRLGKHLAAALKH